MRKLGSLAASLLSLLASTSFAEITLGPKCESDINKLAYTMGQISYDEGEPYCNFIEEIQASHKQSPYGVSYLQEIVTIRVRYEEAIFEMVVHPHLDANGCLIEEVKFSAQ